MKKQRLDYKINNNYRFLKKRSKKSRKMIYRINIFIIILASLTIILSIYYIFYYINHAPKFSDKNTYFIKKQQHLLLINELPYGNNLLHSVILLSSYNTNNMLSYYLAESSLDNKKLLSYYYKKSGPEGIIKQFKSFEIKPVYYVVIKLDLYKILSNSLEFILLHYTPKEKLNFQVNFLNKLKENDYLYYINSKQINDYLYYNKQLNFSKQLSEKKDRWLYFIISLLSKGNELIELFNKNSELKNYLTDHNLPNLLLSKWISKLTNGIHNKIYSYPHNYKKVKTIFTIHPSIKKYKNFLNLIVHYYRNKSSFTVGNYLSVLLDEGIIVLDDNIKLRLIDCRKNSDNKNREALLKFLNQFKLNPFYENKFKNDDYCQDKQFKKSYIVNSSGNLELLNYIKNVLKIFLFYNTAGEINSKNEFLVILGEDFHKIISKLND